MLKTDVVIIGAGAVGCAIARELSKYEIDVIVVDKNEDIGGDASKSNSAIIHTGYDAKPGSLESELVVAANPMYDQIVKDLDIPYERVGAILPAITDEQYEQLPAIKEKAFQNKVYDVEYKSKEELLEMEPNLNPDVKGGLHIPREHIIDAFIMVQAFAENANENGVTFLLNSKVIDIEVEANKIKAVKTEKETIQTKYVINAAALHCDDIAAMVGKANYKVVARRGEFFILDKNTSCKVNRIVLPIPTKITKGKLVSPTIHGNLLVGPTAEDLDNKTDKSVTKEGLEGIVNDVKQLIPGLQFQDTIAQFSGLRPNRNPEGLHVDMYDDLEGYVNLSGVRSTGLTVSVSIAKYVVNLMQKNGLEIEFKEDFVSTRKGTVNFDKLSLEEKEKVIAENPLYGNIICRCEMITEGEIVDAIKRPLAATSIDAIKRRVRAGMGRCQAGFCGPKLIEIIARELDISIEEVNKNIDGSHMITGKTR